MHHGEGSTERQRGWSPEAARLGGCRQAGDGEGDASRSRGLHNQHAAGTGWAGSGAAQRAALQKKIKNKKMCLLFFPAEQQPWRWESARGRGGRFSRQGRAALCPGSHPPACRICFGLSWASQHCCRPFRRGTSAFPALFPSDRGTVGAAPAACSGWAPTAPLAPPLWVLIPPRQCSADLGGNVFLSPFPSSEQCRGARRAGRAGASPTEGADKSSAQAP